MHRRVSEYIARQDQRLTNAQSYVLTALDRPGMSSGGATAPLFGSRDLRRVLTRNDWHVVGSNQPVEETARTDLRNASSELQKRIEFADKLLHSYRKQLASSHMLQGAIAAAIAREAWSPHRKHQFDAEALGHFQNAIQIPGFSSSVVGKQLAAHQLRKLGHAQSALLEYEAVERLAATIENVRERDLLIADCKRWRAAIIQAQTLHNFTQNGNGPQGASNALSLLRRPPAGDDPGALNLLASYEPYRGWEAIDYSDTLYLAAYICHKRQFYALRDSYLEKSATGYKLVLRETSGLGKFASRRAWKLRAAAREGGKRVKLARESQSFNEKWLLPPAQPVESDVS